MTWGLVSKMLGHTWLSRCTSCSSHPRHCTPKAKCLTAEEAVYRCTRSLSVNASISNGITELMYEKAVGPTYSNMKERDFNTPFCTFNSLTLYSFMRAGSTVKGPHVSATIAIATVVHTLSYLSCTFRLLSSVLSTS